MNEDLLFGLASIVIFGVGAQWIAWRFQLPVILLLLILGIIAGPVTGIIEPDKDFGELLLPFVSLSVAVILFEGGLNLRLAELRKVGRVIPILVIIGALVTWMTGSVTAYYLLDFGLDVSVLLGAILIVSGPTVILPLLRHVRPAGRVATILKWEGIVIDPLGAMLAVVVFEAILSGRLDEASGQIAIGIARTLLIGGIAGALGALVLLFGLRRYWIPDFLQSAAALMMVITVYSFSGLYQEESGLLAATVMGLIVGNQQRISVRHIVEFKENLGVLLVSSLFILLAARLQKSDWDALSWGTIGFIAVLIFVARPLAVWLSTIRTNLDWREKVFLMWMAPRGIVAAAVASVFSLRLVDEGYAEAQQLVPVTFAVIIGTVAFYGLTIFPVSRKLQIAQPNPQGVLIVGAHSWAREIAKALQAKGFPVLMVDTQWTNLAAARNAGIPTFYASILSQYALDEIDLGGIGRLLALTPNNTANALAAIHFAPFLGRANVYQLPPGEESSSRKEKVSQHLRGRFLFGPNVTYSYLTNRFNSGAVLKTTALTEKFNYDDLVSYYGPDTVPLFLIGPGGNLTIFTAEDKVKPEPGQVLISLVNPVEELSLSASSGST